MLACSIFEQACRHPRLREPAAQSYGGSPRVKHDLLFAQLEVDLIAWLQVSAIPQRLRNYHLSLSTDPTSHTS
jgi:hypothetical protein